MTLREKEIPEKKIHAVKELLDLMKKKKTVLVASIKNIPASQFQEISKKLRNKVIIKVPKKNLIFRAIDDLKDTEINNLKKYIKDNAALLFSDIDTFDLALELAKNKISARAKTGQEAPEDIVIPAGPTDLMPGPAISELGALGIPIQIEKGKINIKEAKTIVKEGERISADAANVMSKLDIKPIKVGFTPILAFDTQEKKLYLNIEIDKEKTIQELKKLFTKSLGFAVEIGYIGKDTITFLLQKAERNAQALKSANAQQNKSESASEEK